MAHDGVNGHALGTASAESGRRILVVDDQPATVETLTMLLELSGHSAASASDGLEAVQMAEALRPDVVLLDIGLPKLDGYEACRRIREHAWGREMVVIALTGLGHDDDRERARAAGFDMHLVKPVEPEHLLTVLAMTPRAAR
jgi:CheY-like chemotaxis protein